MPSCTDPLQPTCSVSCVFASDDFDARRGSCSQASTSQPASTALQSRQQPVFELACSRRAGKQPEFGELLLRRPVAAVALVPQPIILFSAGAMAGALGTAHCCSIVRRGILQALFASLDADVKWLVGTAVVRVLVHCLHECMLTPLYDWE